MAIPQYLMKIEISSLKDSTHALKRTDLASNSIPVEVLLTRVTSEMINMMVGEGQTATQDSSEMDITMDMASTPSLMLTMKVSSTEGYTVDREYILQVIR